MNRNNCYFDKNDVIGNNIFYNAQHSSFIRRTKTIQESQNVELIKDHSNTIPVIASKNDNKMKDPVREFIQAKQEYLSIKSKLETRLLSMYRFKKISRENNIANSNIKEYILHKFIDPAPYINKTDDFYFYPHHGTLKILDSDNENFLAHPGKGETLRIDKISPEMPMKQIDTIKSCHPTELLLNDTSTFSAIRYRKEVRLAKIPDLNNLQDDTIVETFHTFKHKNDILASSLSDCYLSTIDSKFRFNRFNLTHQCQDININIADRFIDDLVPVSLSNFPSDHDKMKNCISFTTRKSFGAINYKSRIKIGIDCYFTSNNLTLQCENIFSHANSWLRPNLVYIASTHMLYTFDYRKLKEPIVQWTHQLYKPPMMITTDTFGVTEVICVSSNKVGDLKVFNTDGMSVNYYPYRPSSILKTYDELRENGLFLLSDDIKERCNGSVTGISLNCNPIRKSVQLFTQNCYGDVFLNNLSCKKGSTNESDIAVAKERFQQWENHIKTPLDPNKEYSAKERVQNGDLIVNDIFKLESLPKYLNDDKSTEIMDFTQLDTERYEKPKPKWKVSIDEARRYNDVLAVEIMLPWDDVYDSEDDEEEEEEVEEEKAKDKVSTWLENRVQEQVDDVEMEDLSMEISLRQTSSLGCTPSVSKRKSRVTGF